MSDRLPLSNNFSGPYRPFRPPPPPLSIPPGYVAFRLLCHASRIGGVIGKSGNVIKSLQQTTGARIRVEDASLESSERVIFVVAPATIGEFGDGSEVSKAQEALLTVFERILEVAAESDGEVDGVVSCRLLASSPQVGAVIGKGGNVVEKMRRDTGSRIRVLNDRMPACAAPSDEIIEIEGMVKSVKKALVAVSRKLQDCAPADRMKMMGSKSYEGVLHEVHETTVPHPDHTWKRTSALSHLPGSSDLNSSGVHTWASAEVNRASALDPKASQQEVTFRLLCSNDRVGAVIGKGGGIIQAIQREARATISVGPTVAECNDRLITITASENRESRYSPAQKALVLVFSRTIGGGVEKGIDLGSKRELYVTAYLVVPSNQVGCLIGKGGAVVSEMRKATGAIIRMIGSNQVPKCASDNDQLVQISGKFSNVQDALYNTTGRLRDHVFASPQNSSYGRLRDPVTPRGPPTVGDTNSHSDHSLAESLDHLSLPATLDDPLPALWAPHPGTEINSRGINDVGKGLTSPKGGLEQVSESQTVVVTNTTLEIMVPDNLIGSVYGENGSNLVQLREISRAKIIIYEPLPGTSDRTVVISGTPDQVRKAQSLLQAFLFRT